MESKLYKANTKTEEMLVGQHWIFKEYVDRMSDNRMHDILELVPELKDYYFNGRNIDEDAEIVLLPALLSEPLHISKEDAEAEANTVIIDRKESLLQKKKQPIRQKTA